MITARGSFIWYELMTTDANAAARFYGEVVGWKIPTQPTTQPGGLDYRSIIRGDGGMAGGVMQISPDMLAHGARPAWVGYLHVTDVDAAVQAIVADGGRVLMPKMTLPVGDMAMVTDPMGAPFYVMRPVPPPDRPDAQSDAFHPTHPQHVRWNQLQSPDLPRAQAFYVKHFGFELRDVMPMGEFGDYHFIDHGGVRLGGMMKTVSPDAPAGWQFYFGVPSAAAAKHAIEAAGGKVVADLHEVPGGDWVVIAVDPQGAPFGVVGPKGQ